MRQRGFTLLEMLLAFTLLALLFAGLFSAFHTFSRAWDAADARMAATEDLRLVSDFLRRQLGQVMVLKIRGEKTDEPMYAFAGTARSLRYAAPLQPLQHQGGIFLIELSVQPGSQGQALVLRYAPYRPELDWDKALSGTEPVQVFDGLQSVAFAYFGREEADADPVWSSEWKNSLRYPELLKITLADAQRVWPELVVALPQVRP